MKKTTRILLGVIVVAVLIVMVGLYFKFKPNHAPPAVQTLPEAGARPPILRGIIQTEGGCLCRCDWGLVEWLGAKIDGDCAMQQSQDARWCIGATPSGFELTRTDSPSSYRWLRDFRWSLSAVRPERSDAD
jgi:hypothetical protein